VHCDKHILSNFLFNIFNVWQGIFITKAIPDLFRFNPGPFGDGIDFTAIIDRDKAAPITSGRFKPAFFERVDKSGSGIRNRPSVLKRGLNQTRVMTDAFGLLPLFKRKIARIALLANGKLSSRRRFSATTCTGRH
jgi:hypothetical protein